jgi:uncharacterized protein YqeY
MTTKIDIQEALKDAIRSSDEVRKSTLRMVLSAIKLAEVEKGDELDENAILAVFHKEVKTRQEAIEEAKSAHRPDLVGKAEQEIQVLEAFLPEQLSPDELEALVQEVIDAVGATSMREMGQVMKELVPRLQGRATGNQASQVARKLLG